MISDTSHTVLADGRNHFFFTAEVFGEFDDSECGVGSVVCWAYWELTCLFADGFGRNRSEVDTGISPYGYWARNFSKTCPADSVDVLVSLIVHYRDQTTWESYSMYSPTASVLTGMGYSDAGGVILGTMGSVGTTALCLPLYPLEPKVPGTSASRAWAACDQAVNSGAWWSAIYAAVLAAGGAAAVAVLLDRPGWESPPVDADPPGTPEPRPPIGELIGSLVATWGATSTTIGPSTQDEPTEAQLEAVADRCVTLVRQGLGLSATAARDKCVSQPILVPGGMVDFGHEAAQHDLDVIASAPQLVQLEYMSEAAKVSVGVERSWYNTSPFNVQCLDKPSGTQCDEYPFFASVEGGPSAFSSYGPGVLRPISAADNQREGIVYAAMKDSLACGMVSAQPGPVPTPGTKFLVIPVPNIDVATFYICPE